MASSSTPNAPPARQAKQQYALRSQKQLGLVNGTPSYDPVEGFEKPDIATRTYQYSPDGKLLAYVLPTCVQILQAETALPVLELPVANVIEINFSPRATFLATWERPVKLEDGAQHKNLRVWSVASGEEVVSFSEKKQEGWDLQYTTSESHAIRMAGPEIQVYNPADWSKGVVDKLRVEGATSASLSPGQNPNVAVFIAEKKGAPASVQIFGLRTLAAAPTCRKSFFKADRCTIKWNRTGTQVLVLTQTDVDNSNKSYYGETMLYLLSSAGNFDCRVALDKEGPVHDFTWSPNSKEFGVVYGYTPAKAVLFDQRVKTLHDFGSHPINFISFNPQGRLVLLAGFGNLAGKCDIYDRRTLNKVASIDAPNTTFCQWSECGTFILTATLSPRLRVDNGVKIWHCTGALVHTQLVEELYQASWRPTLPEAAPPFPRDIPAAPAPSPSVQSTPVKAPATKPAGAYRPPGAQGRAAPSIFKREDEGGAAYVANNGAATPPRGAPFGTRTPTPVNPNAQNGRGGARRHVPGAAPQPESGPAEKEKKPRKKKGKGEERPRTANPSPREEKPEGAVNGLLHVPAAGSLHLSITSTNPENAGLQSPVGEGSLDPIAKKIRNLNKKLKAIEELKEKAKRGERLETTQLRKMEGEAEIRKELAAVMASASGTQV